MKNGWLKYGAAAIIISLYCCFTNFYNNFLIELLTGIFLSMIVIYCFCNGKNKYSCIKTENDMYELIHDLKTPAIAQLRVSEHLANGTFGILNDSQHEIAVQLNNSARYMFDIVNNFLILCRLKHDNLPFDSEDLDINEIIKQSIADLKYIAADKRCSILFDYSEESIIVKGSKLELKRVIMNLLTNAVKYSYPNRIITTTSKTAKGKYIFNVNSFGDYIKKENVKVICNKYSSLKKSGTGLGLYICEIILNKHNSSIIVQSDCKTGNNFGFELALSKIPVNNCK